MDTGASHFYGSSSDRRAVILTALQVEFQAVRAHLSKIQQERIPQGNIYDVGRFQGAVGRGKWQSQRSGLTLGRLPSNSRGRSTTSGPKSSFSSEWPAASRMSV